MKLHLPSLACCLLLGFLSASGAWAQNATGDAGEAALARLRAALASTQMEVRRSAALELSGLGDKSGVPVVIADFATATGAARDIEVVALRLLRDKRTVPALRGALKDKSSYVREIALAALGEVKAVEAFGEIVAHLSDRQLPENTCMVSTPADSAAYALGALGDERALPLLMAVLEEKGIEDDHFAPTASVMQALGTLTGEKFGYDIKKWKAWWKARQATPGAQAKEQ